MESDSLNNFAKIVHHLANPFSLIGFVLFLIIGVHRALIDLKILQPVDPETSGIIVLPFLRYGFWIGVLVIIFGVGYATWKTYRETVPAIQIAKSSEKAIDALTKQIDFMRLDNQAKQYQVSPVYNSQLSHPNH